MAKALFGIAVSTLKRHRFAAPHGRMRRGREKRVKPVSTQLGAALAEPVRPAEPTPDAVRIAVLAMEGLGRASMRASFTGTEVQVAVPDARTAAVFEAALIETAHRRPTDRLIRIVIA